MYSNPPHLSQGQRETIPPGQFWLKVPVVQIRANSPDLSSAILRDDYEGQSTKTDVKQGLTLNQDQL